MSLVVASLLAAGGLLVGRWIAKVALPKGGDEKGPTGPRGAGEGSVREGGSGAERDLFEGFVCRVGDVVIRTGGDEAWLAGALVFSEEAPVAALFVAPEAGRDRALYVRPRPNTGVIWLEALGAGEIPVFPEPPTALEHAGRAFERVRRLPVRVERVAGAPDVGERVIVAEYASVTGERVVLVTGGGRVWGWGGVVLEEGGYDVLPSGKATL